MTVTSRGPDNVYKSRYGSHIQRLLKHVLYHLPGSEHLQYEEPFFVKVLYL